MEWKRAEIRARQKIAIASQAERVRRFIVLGEPFSVENGMMTPSLKIRRHIIRDAFGKDLEALYAKGAKVS